ncbi:MAG: VOC family protein, partial [Alphaproteobacteria bacterium]
YYPIICTENYAKTVNFYEDHFDFSAAFEMNGFTVLQHKTNKTMYLAILDRNHNSIPEQYKKPVSGMILNFPVKDVRITYQQLYWEGLNIITEPEVTPCARKHFFVEDPNGILIDVTQDVQYIQNPDMDNITILNTGTH